MITTWLAQSLSYDWLEHCFRHHTITTPLLITWLARTLAYYWLEQSLPNGLNMISQTKHGLSIATNVCAHCCQQLPMISFMLGFPCAMIEHNCC